MSAQEFWRIHFVGVGGAGLSALARLSLLQGQSVSGSDQGRSPVVADLEALGLSFQKGHEPGLVRGADLVVVSSAVPADSAEVVWARASGVPVWKRHQFLPWLARDKRMIAVAGTHGKTTTTALLSHILTDTGSDPTCLVGGVLFGWRSNARLGHSDLLVLEADEYDRTFLALSPWLGIVTSVEMDHPDCFASLDDLAGAFHQFGANCRRGLASADDDLAVEATRRASGGARTYGWRKSADWRLLEAEGGPDGLCFEFETPGAERLVASVPLWGKHSAANALAAIAAASEAEVPVTAAVASLPSFAGVERRFAVRGPVAGVHVVDDYAHHPAQIEATIDAARQRFPDSRVVLVFQPHTFSRLSALYSEYVLSLRQGDEAFVLPVYGAREAGDSTGAARRLALDAGATLLPAPAEAAASLLPLLRAGDVVLNLGAGDGECLTTALLEGLAAEARCA